MGVYETLRTWGGRFIFLDRHQKRLNQSCEALGIVAPNLKEILVDYEGRNDVRLKVVVDGEVKITEETLPEWSGNFIYDSIWTVGFASLERDRPEVKNADTFAKDLAREGSGCDEVLLVNRAGEITEGSITNVFFIKNGFLITPASGILYGVMRAIILEAAKQLGIPVIERAVLRSEYADFDTVFLCNSIRGIIQVGNLHPLMLKLEEQINKNYRHS